VNFKSRVHDFIPIDVTPNLDVCEAPLADALVLGKERLAIDLPLI
jgi:hypothetical protein